MRNIFIIIIFYLSFYYFYLFIYCVPLDLDKLRYTKMDMFSQNQELQELLFKV